MISILELAIAAIALAWLVMIVAMAVFYLKINHEKQEIARIKEKIDGNEESIKEISRFFVDARGEQSAL